MTSWLTSAPHFLAADLVFVEGSLAATLLVVILYHQPRLATFHWAIAATLVLLLSFVFALIGTTVHFEPPVGYSKAITSGVPNSFPSHHALLAAVIAALVFLVRPWLTLPFAAVSGIIDVALVQDHDHHVVDVAGSTAFVALATVLTLLVVPALVRWLDPSLHVLSEATRPSTLGNIDTAVRDVRDEMHEVTKRLAQRDAAMLAELARLRDVLEREFIPREQGQ
jgi:hypothetical protein